MFHEWMGHSAEESSFPLYYSLRCWCEVN